MGTSNEYVCMFDVCTKTTLFFYNDLGDVNSPVVSDMASPGRAFSWVNSFSETADGFETYPFKTTARTRITAMLM